MGERQVVGMRLGAGILIALPVGAAAAGPWVLAGIALAGLLALGSLWPAAAGPSNGVGNDTVPFARSTPALRALAVAAGLARVAVFALAFGAYLVPEHPGIVAAALVAVVTAADLAGVRLADGARHWIVGALVLAAGVLIALCFAIAPPTASTPGEASSPGGLLLATAVMFPLLAPERRDHAVRRICGSTLVALALAVAALHQLGPVRLGLSVTSMLDLLAAVDARQLAPLLTAVVVLATVPAALATFTEARSAVTDTAPCERRSMTLVCAMPAVVLTAFAVPAIALMLAATPAFAEMLAGLSARRGDRHD